MFIRSFTHLFPRCCRTVRMKLGVLIRAFQAPGSLSSLISYHSSLSLISGFSLSLIITHIKHPWVSGSLHLLGGLSCSTHLSCSSRLTWACFHGNLESFWERERTKATKGLDWEVALGHSFHILLARAGHREMGMGKMPKAVWWRDLRVAAVTPAFCCPWPHIIPPWGWAGPVLLSVW